MNRLDAVPLLLLGVCACGSGEQSFSHPVFADDDFTQVAFMLSNLEKPNGTICISTLDSGGCPGNPKDHQLVVGVLVDQELTQLRAVGKKRDGGFRAGSVYYMRSAGYVVVTRVQGGPEPGVFIVTPDGSEEKLEGTERVVTAIPSRDGEFIAVVQRNPEPSDRTLSVVFFEPLTAMRIAEAPVQSARWLWTDDGLFRGASASTAPDDLVVTINPATGEKTEATLDACYLSETTSRNFDDQEMKLAGSGLFPKHFRLVQAPTRNVDCDSVYF